MDIVVVVPFPQADKGTAIWSREERKIDFLHDADRAARCTSAFAAVELKRYLERTVRNVRVRFADNPPTSGVVIDLQIQDIASREQSFTLQPRQKGLAITGRGRTGLLYGTYEFLRLQGWRWYAPGPIGEVEPALKEELILPEEIISCAPSMDYSRGLDMFHPSQQSSELLLWMARNRLNTSGCGCAIDSLASKLGMIPKTGGHIFDTVLVPDHPTTSGKSLWEEHQEWFGLPADGVRKKESALKIQFCVSQPDLIEYLAEELLRYLNDEWIAADQVDVWGFDSWGNTCMCEKCKQLGNDTDKVLFLASKLRDILNEARKDGRLKRDIKIGTCSYEGTCTLNAPIKPVPRNLIEAGDYCTYYPINRCYEHDLADASCPFNTDYCEALRNWGALRPQLPVIIGEYYNVSKFEDLPLLFTNRIRNDLQTFHELGVRGVTYMHVPFVNWAMRALTNSLFAQLAWDINTNVDAFLAEYFEKYYGPYAEAMRKAYEFIEKAWLNITSWRAWSAKSVLSTLHRWDGAKPDKPLTVDDHLTSPHQAVAKGRESVSMLCQALDGIKGVLEDCRESSARNVSLSGQMAVNPAEARRLEQVNKYEKRLADDRRLMIYGIDTMMIMTELVAYNDALFHDDHTAAERAWAEVEQTANRMDSYYMPLTFVDYEVGIETRDALTRSQVRELLSRCRKYRLARPEVGKGKRR